MDLQLDHLVPEAYRITHASGIVPGEQVRFFDERSQQPSVVYSADYYASDINGDDVTIVHYSVYSKSQIEITVKARNLFATSPLLELYNGVAADMSIALRKSNIEIRARGLDPDFVLEQQLNALARGCALLQKNGRFTVERIFVCLAVAEIVAQFRCGFCSLAAIKSYLELLKQCAIGRGIITVDENDFVTLTDAGVERSKIALPPQIEQYL